MKKNIVKILIYSALLVLFFIIGAAISDAIVIGYAKYILKTADSLNFEKDMEKVYPTLDDKENGLDIIRQVYSMRQNFPDDLKGMDIKITHCPSNSIADIQDSLRNSKYSSAEAELFWKAPQVAAATEKLTSIPYTTKFSFNYASDNTKFDENIFMLKAMRNFYLHYLKYCAEKGEKLQTLNVFQKLLILNRALNKQNLQNIENQKMDFWILSLDTLVHYGPSEKRYLEYYQTLQKLVNAIDFEYHAELTRSYNKLHNALDFSKVKGNNLLERRNTYIYNIKETTQKLYDDIKIYPLDADPDRSEPLDKDIFAKKQKIIKTKMNLLMAIKLYQIQNGKFPEKISELEDFKSVDFLEYKRLSDDDFILK